MTCAPCHIAQQRARSSGFKDWREGVCFEHAAVELDAWLKERGAPADQTDLFQDLAA